MSKKAVLYGLGTILVIVGFSMLVYGEIRLNTPSMCPANGCNPLELDYQIVTIPTILVYVGIGLMIAGGMCMMIGRKISD